VTSAGQASPDPALLRDALNLITSPVAIVGVRAGDRLGGLTAAWLVRTSHEPPLLAVSIGHERHTRGLLLAADHFAVSILREGQVDLGRHFGLQSQRDVDKWPAVEHVLLGGLAPALTSCSARFLCRIEDRFRTGDHDLFVGRITLAEVVDGGPPLPLRGKDYVPG
jgi:flavin reductase (DIM6/NTAB) family NADH-FMN oxidoreductase RutF